MASLRDRLSKTPALLPVYSDRRLITLSRESWHLRCVGPFEMQIQFSRKSLSFFVVLAVLLAPIFFFSVRFLPKDTATQHDQVQSHTPSDTAERPKAREPAEPPPDRTIE